ncbi:unnamed protein product [Brassica napus]|uniref:(rape) hypothetical protein n=1 Tax=Brassica napus TaxID=3708 RepID=A0A816V5E2_BRANA|nr:unnamed protein product [Brassica napus]
MPSGAKKRKALKKKKKKEQEAIGASPSNKGFDGHGNDEHGSLSSPGSQGYGELCTRDPSPSPLSSLMSHNESYVTIKWNALFDLHGNINGAYDLCILS